MAQQKCILETELERTVSWAVLGLGNYSFLLPGLQPDSPAFWWALNWEGREDRNWYEFRVRAKDELKRSGSHLECRAHRHLCKDTSLTCPKLCPVYFLRSPVVARLWGLMWWGRVTPSQPISNADFLFWWVWLLALCSVTGWWPLLWLGREKDDDKNLKCVEFWFLYWTTSLEWLDTDLLCGFLIHDVMDDPVRICQGDATWVIL